MGHWSWFLPFSPIEFAQILLWLDSYSWGRVFKPDPGRSAPQRMGVGLHTWSQRHRPGRFLQNNCALDEFNENTQYMRIISFLYSEPKWLCPSRIFGQSDLIFECLTGVRFTILQNWPSSNVSDKFMCVTPTTLPLVSQPDILTAKSAFFNSAFTVRPIGQLRPEEAVMANYRHLRDRLHSSGHLASAARTNLAIGLMVIVSAADILLALRVSDMFWWIFYLTWPIVWHEVLWGTGLYFDLMSYSISPDFP